MALPYDKSGNIEFEIKPGFQLTKNIMENDLIRLLSNQNLSEINQKDDKITFTTNNSLFKIPYNISLSLDLTNTLKISYVIKFLALLKVTIIVAIVAAFFAKMNIEKFIFFEIALIIVFFAFNMALADFSIRKLLTNFAQVSPYLITDQIEEDLTVRMDDSSKCPACGEPLNDMDLQCPSCKLHIPLKRGFKQYDPNAIPEKPKPKPKPNQEIKYTYVEKKK